MDKTYEFEVLWGFGTDTHDILGLVTNIGAMPKKLEKQMPKILEKIKEKKMTLPLIYRSYTKIFIEIQVTSRRYLH
jgi:tRNA U55 pseudouridine synthase TruB